ncbi:SH3 domain-containing protein [Siminovitchia sp. 179-K 8D1 HS]|uniref:SH3 domain-containing protein n=1 Tax=Siminovitchia sp. 179-K 8D1 HS TaxID=3142385 RepID=UPI0039A12AD9
MNNYIDNEPFKNLRIVQDLLKITVQPSWVQILENQKKRLEVRSFQIKPFQTLQEQIKPFQTLQEQLKILNKRNSMYLKSSTLTLQDSIQKNLISSLDIQFQKLNNHSKIMNWYSDSFSKVIKSSIDMNLLFKDITIDNLSVFNEIEIFTDKTGYLIHETQETCYNKPSKPKYVYELTVDEFQELLKNGQSIAAKEHKPEKRIKTFIAEIVKNLLVTGAGQLIIFFIVYLYFQLSQIAIGNHDFKVLQAANMVISESQTVSATRKVFINNQDLERPMGQMGFLRVSSELRERPSKKSPRVMKEYIRKNTVVIPLERKGNWIKIEVEAETEIYVGWVQESKVIKFKLD